MDVAVIGGGIAGASVAYHLSEAGRDATVYERDDLAGATTAKSAAFFGFYGSDVERRMKRYASTLYNEFLADPRADPRYDLVGRLRVATTGGGAEGLRDHAGGDGVEYLAPGALHERLLLPELDAGAIEGASYRPAVGYYTPRELAREFAARARGNGARIEQAAVEDVLAGDRVEGLVVDGREVAVDEVVCAAGPWNPRVARWAGVDLPIHHSLAPIIRLDPGGLPHALPIVSHAESGVYVRGDRDGTVLVGHHPIDPEPGGIDPGDVDGVPPALRERMRDAVAELFPGLADAPAVEEWVGVRSHTPDGHPVAGPTAVEGFSVVAFDSSGIQLSPAAGRAVAGHLAGDPPDYADAVAPSRFG